MLCSASLLWSIGLVQRSQAFLPDEAVNDFSARDVSPVNGAASFSCVMCSVGLFWSIGLVHRSRAHLVIDQPSLRGLPTARDVVYGVTLPAHLPAIEVLRDRRRFRHSLVVQRRSLAGRMGCGNFIMKVRRVHWARVVFGGFGLAILGSAAMIGLRIRQEQLDRSLIQAIKQNDTSRALSALNQGANANALDMPRVPFTWPTALEYLKQLFQPKSKTTHPAHYNSALSLFYDGRLDKNGSGYSDHRPPENVVLIKALLDHGADPNSKAIDNTLNVLSDDPLHCAAYCNHAETVRMLLQHHADPDSRSESRDTPLFWANSKVAAILLDHGATVNVRSIFGYTALNTRIFYSDLEAMKTLVNHGADVNAYDDHHRSIAG